MFSEKYILIILCISIFNDVNIDGREDESVVEIDAYCWSMDWKNEIFEEWIDKINIDYIFKHDHWYSASLRV